MKNIRFCSNCNALTNTKVKIHFFVNTKYNGLPVRLFMVKSRWCDACNSFVFDPKFDDAVVRQAKRKLKNVDQRHYF